MKDHRPINLDLGSLKYPPMAIVSILHRISGLILFILMPVMIYFLQLSLESLGSFEHLAELITQPYLKLVIWVFASALVYHALAGFRHLAMDVGLGEELGAGRVSAIIVITLAVIITIFLGIWIW